VTKADGTTIQLADVWDLDDWLTNITGKRIRINANVEVSDDYDLILTPNEYWIFGERIEGNLYLLDGKHTIVSFATRLGNARGFCFVRNYDPDRRTETNVSGLKLFIIGGDVMITGRADMVLKNVSIHIEDTDESDISYIEGDVYACGRSVNIYNSVIRFLYLDSHYATLDSITNPDYEGIWVIKTHEQVSINNVNSYNVNYVHAIMRHNKLVNVGANSSVTIDLPSIGYRYHHYRVVFIGVRKGSNPYYYDPLPSGVTYSLDEANRKIVINNTTANAYTILVTYEVATELPRYVY
jgi:hypothetical protein